MARDQDVSGSNKRRHYCKIYVRRSHVDKIVDDQEINHFPLVLQNSPSDPSPMTVRKVVRGVMMNFLVKRLWDNIRFMNKALHIL